MQFLLFVFSLIVGAVFANPAVPQCKPLKNAENLDLPDITLVDQSKLNGAEVFSMADLKADLEDPTPIIVFSSFYQQGDNTCRAILHQYLGLLYREAIKYKGLRQAFVKCPSEACAHLKVATFVDLTFYRNGVAQGRLTDTMEENDFLDKVKGITKEDHPSSV